jgi:hypothetical protein
MVLHIESSLMPRDAARLEACNRAADINAGPPESVASLFEAADSKRFYVLFFGQGELRVGGRFVKSNPPQTRTVPASSGTV